MAMRGGSHGNTLLGSSLIDGRMSAATNNYGNPMMVKSNSGASIGATDDKLQRS